MRTSLIISVYNRPDFLDPILCSIARQTVLPDEVIVSEDGELPAMAQVTNHWSTRWPRGSTLRHVTQEDRGNRKPRAMNNAIRASTGDYVLFIDGDCVLRRDYVADHLALREPDAFLTGRRVELSPKASKWLTSERIATGVLDTAPWPLLLDSMVGETKHLEQFFRVPLVLRERFGLNRVHDIRACNLSVHREHLFKVNGFDNTYSGAYGEDSDLELRLRFAGIRMKGIRGAAIQYHLWHPTQTHDPTNQTRLDALKKRGTFVTDNGIAQL